MSQPARHTVPRSLLRRLCGPDDDLSDLRSLRRGAISKSLLRIRILRDLLRDEAHPAATAFASNVAALAAIQRSHPTVVDDILSGPHFSAWATSCIRRLTEQAGPEAPNSATSISTDVAQLGCFLVAAAIQVGQTIDVTVPVRAGRVVIPAAGSVEMPSARGWATATIHNSTNGLSVNAAGAGPAVHIAHPTTPSTGWTPLARVRADLPGGGRWEMAVDPIDPFFECFDLPRAHPDDGAVRQFGRIFGKAGALLASLFPDKLIAMAKDLTCFVPISTSGNQIGLSATSIDAPGAVALTGPTNFLQLAATLVHEHQHFKLNALHDVIPLHTESSARYYSPWRDDSRPVSGLLHGAYAFLGVGEYWRRICALDRAQPQQSHLEFARIRHQISFACTILERSEDLTGAGRELTAHIAAQVRNWHLSDSCRSANRIAEDLLVDHEVRWRIRNISYRDDELRELVDSLPDAPGCTPTAHSANTRSVVDSVGPGYGTESRLSQSARFWLGGGPAVSPVDQLLLDGQYERAASAVIQDIEASASSEDWITFVVAARHTELTRHHPLLFSHPELVWALYTAAHRRQLSTSVNDLLDRLHAAPTGQVAGTSISLSARI